MLKKVLATVAGAVLALSIGAASAYFTTQVQVPDNYIKLKKVAISAEPTSAAVYVDSLAPGQTAIRPLWIANDGSLPVDVRVTAFKKAGYTALYESLTCKVLRGDLELYNGPVSALRTTPFRLDSGAREDLRLEVGLPSSVDNALAEDYVKLSFNIDAEQAH